MDYNTQLKQWKIDNRTLTQNEFNLLSEYNKSLYQKNYIHMNGGYEGYSSVPQVGGTNEEIYFLKAIFENNNSRVYHYP